MKYFLIIYPLVLQFYFCNCFFNSIIFYKDFIQYDKIYKTLRGRKYFLDTKHEIIFSSANDIEDMIMWSYKRNSFALKAGLMLFPSITHYFNSPYSLYWLWKYKKWFNDNLDLSVLEEKNINS